MDYSSCPSCHERHGSYRRCDGCDEWGCNSCLAHCKECVMPEFCPECIDDGICKKCDAKEKPSDIFNMLTACCMSLRRRKGAGDTAGMEAD